jgi:competence protein ComEA
VDESGPRLRRSEPDASGGGRHALRRGTEPLDDVDERAERSGALRERLRGLVPESLTGSRLDPGRRGAASVVVVALIAAAVVAFVSWRSRPASVPVTAPAVVRSAGLAGSGAPAAPVPSAGTAPLVVAVAGKVRRPGVVTLPAGSRVIDAVKAAGGQLPGTDIGTLNLARRLADGELVVVGGPAPADQPAPAGGGSSVASGQSSGPLDLNAATVEQFDSLPGVGPVLAQRIVDYRTAHGRFESVDQLRDVDGIGDSKFGQLKDKVTV